MTEENTNLGIWGRLSKTDPAHTKKFARAGGFKGTAIKPIYTTHKMTEEFGPAGKGWGMGKPEFQVVAGNDGQVAVYCTVELWWNDPSDKDDYSNNTVYGVGGDMVVVKQSSGLRTDDEAFKKAFTDAMSNAMKHIGMSADVHMGLFDDSKYVQEMQREFSEDADEPPVEAQWKETKHPLKEADRRVLWERMMDDLQAEAPKGSDAMIRYMQHPDTQRDLATLEPWKDRFRREAADLIKVTQEAENALGENVASIKPRVEPDFDALTTE